MNCSLDKSFYYFFPNDTSEETRNKKKVTSVTLAVQVERLLALIEKSARVAGVTIVPNKEEGNNAMQHRAEV